MISGKQRTVFFMCIQQQKQEKAGSQKDMSFMTSLFQLEERWSLKAEDVSTQEKQ